MFTAKADNYFSNQTEEETQQAPINPLTSNPVTEEREFNHEFDVIEKNAESLTDNFKKEEKKNIVRDSAPESDLTLEVKNAEALSGWRRTESACKTKSSTSAL